jgi:diguanylate cyclase (GGDEF)-like protein
MRTFERDYKYLLLNLIPRNRLSVERRRGIERAIASEDPTEIRRVSVLALEDLCGSDYFRRSGLQFENGNALLTYVRTKGFYQVRVQLPEVIWQSLGLIAPESGSVPEPAPETGNAPAPVIETTIEILPDIIRSLSIDDERESMIQRLDSVVQMLPHWLTFAGCQFIAVAERTGEEENGREFISVQSEKEIRKRVIYDRCRRNGQIELFDAQGARTLRIADPFFETSLDSVVQKSIVAVAPIFVSNNFWGILEVWMRQDDAGPGLLGRMQIAQGMMEQMIENSVRLEAMTSIDKLTRVYNRQFYDRQVRIEIERATRQGAKLTMLVLDVDDFSNINNTLGHKKGDEALVVIADLIRGNLRKIDLAFRYGGEEFVILLPGTAEVEAIHTAERLRLVISEYDRFLGEGGSTRPISVSIGAAVFPDHAQSEEELFSKADAAMFRAKRAGKNRVEFCDG